MELLGTPPSEWYRDESFYQREQTEIFHRNWIFLGRDRLGPEPGSYFTDVFADEPYLITRDSSGQARAFLNICRHHGTCVARGEGRAHQFSCPYHGWTYDIEGRLTGVPRLDRSLASNKENLGLIELSIKKVGPFFFGFLGEEFEEFELSHGEWLEKFKDLKIEGLLHVATRIYNIDCNWKVYVDNYLDGGYHVPVMHRDLAKGLDLTTYTNHIYGNFSIQECASKNREARLGERAQYLWLYPNLMLNRYGPILDLNWVRPLSPTRTQVIFEYFHESSDKNEIRHFLEHEIPPSDQVQKEDMEICGLVQTGMRSRRYSRGYYALPIEEPMRHFHQLIKKDLSI